MKLLPLGVDDTAPVHELPPTDQPTAPATQLGTGGGAQDAPLGPVQVPAEHEYVADPRFPFVEPTDALLPSEVSGTVPEQMVPPTDQLAVPEAQELGGGGGGVVQEAPKGPLHDPEVQLKVADPVFPLEDVTLNEPPLLTAPAAPEQLLPPTDQLNVPPEQPGAAGAAHDGDEGPIHDPAEQLNDAEPLLPLLDVTMTEPPLATDDAVPEQLSAPTDQASVPPLQPPGTQLGFDVDQDPAVQVAVTLPL